MHIVENDALIYFCGITFWFGHESHAIIFWTFYFNFSLSNEHTSPGGQSQDALSAVNSEYGANESRYVF